MPFQEYDPGSGSTEDLYEQITGTKPKKPRRPGANDRLYWIKGPGGKAVQVRRSDPLYKAAKEEAEKGLPSFDDVTYLEAVFFNNGPDRKPGVPQFRIKLGWTCAPPYLVDRTKKRLTERLIPLAVREQARDNWNRKGRKHGGFQPAERDTIDALLGIMQTRDAARQPGEPNCLVGCMQHVWGGEGTIRHGVFGLVGWRPVDDGWLPNLALATSFDGNLLLTRDRETGEPRQHIRMVEGRGEKVIGFGSHYSDEMLRFLKVPIIDRLVEANIRRMAK